LLRVTRYKLYMPCPQIAFPPGSEDLQTRARQAADISTLNIGHAENRFDVQNSLSIYEAPLCIDCLVYTNRNSRENHHLLCCKTHHAVWKRYEIL